MPEKRIWTPPLSFVQLHGTGTEQIHVRVEELDLGVMGDEVLEAIWSDDAEAVAGVLAKEGKRGHPSLGG